MDVINAVLQYLPNVLISNVHSGSQTLSTLPIHGNLSYYQHESLLRTNLYLSNLQVKKLTARVTCIFTVYNNFGGFTTEPYQNFITVLWTNSLGFI